MHEASYTLFQYCSVRGMPATISDSMPQWSSPRRILKNPGRTPGARQFPCLTECPRRPGNGGSPLDTDSFVLLTVIPPVGVPGVSSQPVGGPVFDPPAQDPDRVASDLLPGHVLVHPCKAAPTHQQLSPHRALPAFKIFDMKKQRPAEKGFLVFFWGGFSLFG